MPRGGRLEARIDNPDDEAISEKILASEPGRSAR